MGRPLRNDFDGAWHHVMHRGAGRRIVFHDDQERSVFLRLVGELDERFRVEVHAFVLMGNHFHLLVRSAEGRLSDAMQWLLSNFTRWMNARRGVDGAIFRGRYHGVNVLAEEHRFLLFRYLAENPIDLGPDVDPLHYEWSSLPSVRAGTSAIRHPWLHTTVIERMYGDRAAAMALGQAGHGADVQPGAGWLLDALGPEPAFERVRLAADVASGLSGVVETKGLRVGTVLAELDDAGPWSRSDLGRIVSLTPSAVASAIHRARRAAEAAPSVDRFRRRVMELADPGVCLTPSRCVSDTEGDRLLRHV